ncbi:MAG: DUF6799 domain-containing protein [Chthoniobacterales bacterium]
MKNNLLKYSFIAACIALTPVASLRAEDAMKPDGTNHEKNEKMQMDGCMMMNGKMMECKGGKQMEMTKDMEMSDGTKVMKDGSVMMKGGKTMKMKDGDMIGMDGKMMPRTPAATMAH